MLEQRPVADAPSYGEAGLRIAVATDSDITMFFVIQLRDECVSTRLSPEFR
jgi:hypothetical protein